MDNVLNRSFITHRVSNFLVKSKRKKKLKVNFGSEYLLDPESFTQTIENIIRTDEIEELKKESRF